MAPQRTGCLSRHQPLEPEILPAKRAARRRIWALCEWIAKPREQVANADKHGLTAAIRLRTNREAASSPSSYATKRTGSGDCHLPRKSAATACYCEFSRIHARLCDREQAHSGHFAKIFDQGVIMTTTKTESSASTTEPSGAPRTRRRVLLAIAAVVLAAALAVIIWALTRSSSSAPPAPSAPVDPYVQFCDNSPSLCDN